MKQLNGIHPSSYYFFPLLTATRLNVTTLTGLSDQTSALLHEIINIVTKVSFLCSMGNRRVRECQSKAFSAGVWGVMRSSWLHVGDSLVNTGESVDPDKAGDHCHADWVRTTDWKLEKEGGAWNHWFFFPVKHCYLQGNMQSLLCPKGASRVRLAQEWRQAGVSAPACTVRPRLLEDGQMSRRAEKRRNTRDRLRICKRYWYQNILREQLLPTVWWQTTPFSAWWSISP